MLFSEEIKSKFHILFHIFQSLGFILFSALILTAYNIEIPENALLQSLALSASRTPDFFLFRQKKLFNCVDENCFAEKLKAKSKYRYNVKPPIRYQPFIEYDWGQTNSVFNMENDLKNKRGYSYSQIYPACVCTPTNHYVDLGPEHYPRSHDNVTCTESNRNICSRGTQCKGKPYAMRILIRRPKNESYIPESDNRLQLNLPDEFNDEWMYKIFIFNNVCYNAPHEFKKIKKP